MNALRPAWLPAGIIGVTALGAWFFTLPASPWPPTEEAIRAARDAEGAGSPEGPEGTEDPEGSEGPGRTPSLTLHFGDDPTPEESPAVTPGSSGRSDSSGPSGPSPTDREGGE